MPVSARKTKNGISRSMKPMMRENTARDATPAKKDISAGTRLDEDYD